MWLRETLCLCVFIVCFVYSQVQNQLSQTSEKLHDEAAQRQQLSEEFEQVSAISSDLFFSL